MTHLPYLMARLRARIVLIAAIVWHIVRPAPAATTYRLALPAGPVPELPDWDAESLAEARRDPDPLTDPLLVGTDLVDPLLYNAVHADHRIDMGWQPPTASQSWALAGELNRQLGDTQTFEVVR